ncbi:hypothetical protein [Nocardia sp. NPDC057668]|uniref:hypothetical protein n=1 Tax=Nocardia sp. NPDC057668 TaxID=3346202 RepID=UPI00366B350F
MHRDVTAAFRGLAERLALDLREWAAVNKRLVNDFADDGLRRPATALTEAENAARQCIQQCDILSTTKRTTDSAFSNSSGEEEPLAPDKLARILNKISVSRRLDAELTSEEIEKKFGILTSDQIKIQRAAQTRNIIIDMRPANPDSIKWLRSGISVPKPREIKNKTITYLDVVLGADHANLGLVGIYDPRLPDRPNGVSDEQWGTLEKRYLMRLQEWNSPQSRSLDVDDTGAVYDLGRDGRRRPVSSDYDLWALRYPNGSLIDSRHVYEGHVYALRDYHDIRVMHGTTAQWSARTEKDLSIVHGQLIEHSAGGTPLIRFEPRTLPSARWVDSDLIPLHHI